MRLIDADKIKQSVTNEMLKAELNSPVYCTLECVIADIDKQPTAYDVDKAVERLKQIKTDNSCKNCTYREKCDELQEFYNPSDEVDLCALVTKELSIEIVKSGGIE